MQEKIHYERCRRDESMSDTILVLASSGRLMARVSVWEAVSPADLGHELMFVSGRGTVEVGGTRSVQVRRPERKRPL